MHIRKHITKDALLSIVLIGFSIGTVNAGPVTLPNTFTSGTPAVAAEVNGNFNAVKTAVDDNDSRVGTNAIDIANLTATVNALLTRITALETDNTALQNLISNVAPYMTGGTDAQGQPTVFFSGVNVHVNNGEGGTATVDGTGNLIVGYDERLSANVSFCSIIDGGGNAYTLQADCENNSGVWGTAPQKIGSHNLVIGIGHNYTQHGGLIAGFRNTVASSDSSISGGIDNVSNGSYGSVSGGASNTASGVASSVSGGISNTASGSSSSVSGGNSNTASGSSSSVSGGITNAASSSSSSVSGGSSNTASGAASSVIGGLSNTASSSYSSVSGGNSNTASGGSSSVSGGANRDATGTNDWVAGTLFENN